MMKALDSAHTDAGGRGGPPGQSARAESVFGAAGSVTVVSRPPLTWWERSYLPEVARGLVITSRHFFRNLTIHLLHRVGLARHARGAVTYQYPEEQRPTAPRLRTRHRLTRREDGSPRCVACMMCETVCPAKCIYIVGEEHPDPNIEKRPTRFDIDLGMCVYCGYCVEVCPEDAIRMDTQIHAIAASSRQELILTMDRLLHPEREGATFPQDAPSPS